MNHTSFQNHSTSHIFRVFCFCFFFLVEIFLLFVTYCWRHKCIIVTLSHIPQNKEKHFSPTCTNKLIYREIYPYTYTHICSHSHKDNYLIDKLHSFRDSWSAIGIVVVVCFFDMNRDTGFSHIDILFVCLFFSVAYIFLCIGFCI